MNLRQSTAQWVQGPNASLFQALKASLGKLPFIAEDLGYITREVNDLRKSLDIPGMKILQFGFGNKGAHVYLPHTIRHRLRRIHRNSRQRHRSWLVEHERD